jgi:hypothetical protein
MKQEEPNSASAKDKAEGSREKVNEPRPKPEVDGKNDSGPEPDVHNREIPPQQ